MMKDKIEKKTSNAVFGKRRGKKVTNWKNKTRVVPR